MAAELNRLLPGCTVLDAVPLHPPVAQPKREELLLVLAGTEPDTPRLKLLAVCGGPRARVSICADRIPKARFATGPRTDQLRRLLVGARCTAALQPAHERILTLQFEPGPGEHQVAGPLRLHLELFGPQGLWCLLDGSDTVLATAHPVRTKQRAFGRGDAYNPPPAARPPTDPPPIRFDGLDVLEQVDHTFAAWDLQAAQQTERQALERARDKALARLRHRADGLRRKLATADEAGGIRGDADLLQAYGHLAVQGAPHLDVPDPEDPDATRRIPLRPDLPVREQAAALYRRARKLADGRSRTAADLAKAEQELADAEGRAGGDVMDPAHRAGLMAWLQPTGLLPPALSPEPKRAKGQRPGKREQELHRFRRFTSREGLPILCGRTREDNDRLSLKIARGNDLWFHVGAGYAGSHVVVRLQKNSSASLETLLDAATVAVHFSKARGGHDIEVIYTHAKHVRKRKGMPAGAVIPSHTKTLRVPHDPDRLQRILDTAPEPEPDHPGKGRRK